MANGGKPNRPLRPRGGSGPGNRRRRVVIDNAASATGRNPANVAFTTPASTATVTTTQTPSLTVVKSATPGTVATVGQNISYNFLVTNTGTTAVNGWRLGLTFPGDQRLTNAWNATVSQSGTSVTATNLSYNAAIPPGGNTSFGMQGTWSASDASPTASPNARLVAHADEVLGRNGRMSAAVAAIGRGEIAEGAYPFTIPSDFGTR